MNKDIRFIINKVKEYSRIPSPSGQEKEFLNYLKKDFPNKNYFLKEYPDCLFYEYKKPTKWLVVAHVDRVSVRYFRSEVLYEELLKGQIDNVVSVAILRLLVEKNVPINFLFTTKEEILQSCPQIVNVCYGKDFYVVCLDIDVAVNFTEVFDGPISLRDRDTTAEFNKELVMLLRKICDKNGINYITKDGNWLIDELGCTIAGVPTIKGAYVGLPINNYHTGRERISFKCISNVIKLFECIANE